MAMAKVKGDFINWSRLGDEVKIDGVDVYYQYNADLVTMENEGGSVESEYQLQVGKSDFDVFDHDFANGSLKLTFYLPGRSKQEALTLASELVAVSKHCRLTTGPDLTAEYMCVLTSYNVSMTEVEYVAQVELNFVSVRRVKLKTVSATNVTSVIVDNPGTLASGVRIKVRSTTAQSNVSVAGIVIKNMTANVDYVIDGIEGTFTKNGIIDILNTNLSVFPKIQPGKQTLTSNKALNWTVEFYPTFVV